MQLVSGAEFVFMSSTQCYSARTLDITVKHDVLEICNNINYYSFQIKIDAFVKTVIKFQIIRF